MYVITTETPEAGARRLWERVPHDTICEQTDRADMHADARAETTQSDM